jgi:uncharacterized protein
MASGTLPGVAGLIPTVDEIRALHEKYAPTQEAFDLVYTHCEIVGEIAAQLLARTEHNLNTALVRAGCLLHDIGVYRLYDAGGKLDAADYVRHGLLGYELLRAEGFPDEVCRFCARHTGMGLTRDDVRNQNLPLPLADYLAESDEEKLVMYADKFHSKSRPPTFYTVGSALARVRRYGADKATTFTLFRDGFGVPDLTPFVARYGYATV